MLYENKVAIIGRPNVGKSTFFNIVTGSRKALVKNQPGVTRDIQVEEADWRGRSFHVIDTGGLTDSSDVFSQLIQTQVRQIIDSVDAIVIILDGRSGVCPEDRDVVQIARVSGKPFRVVVNKVDRREDEMMAEAEFAELGENLICASFERRRNVDEVLDWMIEQFSEDVQKKAIADITLTIVGKPNVGKSSLCNHLLGSDRMMVSDVAGTTVDSIDSRFSFRDREYLLIDTAGLRRKAKRKEGVERLASVKSSQSISRANIVIHMIDGTMGPTDQDARIIQQILEEHKGVILTVNKSDLGKAEMPEYRKTVREQISKVFHFFDDIPIVFISAKTGQGIESLFDMIDDMSSRLKIRIPTGDLNDFFMSTIRRAPAPVHGTRNVRFYYLTQTRQVPPSFIAFVNHPQGVDPSYRRFLVKHMKKRWDLQGIPIRIFAMKSRGRGERDTGGARD
jgi:GTP-binding protein